MASIKKRKSTFSVIYWYLDNAGERKQKWDTLETKKEAKQRKAFVEYDWFSDSAVPHNTRHIALHDIVFRTS